MPRWAGVFFITLAILFTTYPVQSETTQVIEPELIIDTPNHSWINQTLSVNGSSTLKPDVATWSLLDLGDDSIIVNGSYLTTVNPISLGNWNWSIIADVDNISCFCELVVLVGLGEGAITSSIVIYIGESPHIPDIRLATAVEGYHADWIMVELLGASPNNGVQSSSIEVELCPASAGECDSDYIDTNAVIDWYSANHARLNISLSSDLITDGQWQAKVVLIDAGLSESAPLKFNFFVDKTPPIAKLIGDSESKEFAEILLDGSSSSDGYWSEQLQFSWIIENPAGKTYFASESQISQNVLHLIPEDSGQWHVTLRVVDVKGRSNEVIHTINVEDVDARITMSVDGFALENGDLVKLTKDSPWVINVAVNDSQEDLSGLEIEWELDGGKHIGESLDLKKLDLDHGEHEIDLKITTDEDEYLLTFSILIPEESTENSSRALFWIAMILIISFSISLLKIRLKTRSSRSSSLMPKWNNDNNDED